jgi:hypothetical protein
MLVVLSLIAAKPALSFAACKSASSTALTRAQVKQEIMDLEAAGYDLARTGDNSYPDDLLQAEAKLAEKRQHTSAHTACSPRTPACSNGMSSVVR